MVWFTFTFLLGIPNVSSDDKSKKPPENSMVDKNYTEIEISKPSFSCHIEYVLFPTDLPKQIDVNCWEEVARIYYESTNSAIKPLVVNKLRWIYFRVNHEVQLSTEDIRTLHGHVVRVSLNLGNKKFGDQAKSDPVKKFFGPAFTDGDSNTIRKQLFQPVSEYLEDLEAISFFKEHLTPRQQLYINLDTTVETSEIYDRLLQTMVKLSEEYHDENHEKISSPPPPLPPQVKNLLLPDPGKQSVPDKKGKDKTAGDKKKDAKNEDIEFFVTADNFFSGRKTFENCAKYVSKELPYLLNFIKVRNAMTKPQAEFYNPLSVTLNHCNCLPVDNLKNRGVTVVKFQFSICNEYLVESNLLPVADSIKLNFTRTILTDSTDKSQLIYFLQTGGLRINMLGNLAPEKRVPLQCVYDEEALAANLRRHKSPEGPPSKDNFVLLGTAFQDISSILLQPHRVLLKCNLQIPPDESYSRGDASFSEATTIYEFYSHPAKKWDLGLSQSSTSTSPILTISVRMGHPLTKMYQAVAMNPNLLNRLFAVIYDKGLAISIIQFIENDTTELLEPVNFCRKGLNVHRPLSKKHRGRLKSLENATGTHVTGFLIDSIDKILLYVEGSLFGSIQQIWALLSYLQPSQGHVLYDSSLIFTERLYPNFSKYGGILKLNLQKDAEVTWSKPKRCGDVPMPELAWKAVVALNMLIHCKSIKTATQNNLFPNPDSLYCLALEFGIPIQMCKRLN